MGISYKNNSAGVNASTPARRKPGFTLTELLVVISIVVILAVLIYSTIYRSRESAMEAACLANMRQIGVAIYSYSAETGFLPHSAAAANGTDWDNFLVRNGNLPDLKLSREGCPKNRLVLKACFGYNYRQLGNEDPTVPVADRPTDPRWGKRRLTEVEKPTETIMLADGHNRFRRDEPGNQEGWPSLVYWDSRFWPTSEKERGGEKGKFQPLGHNGRVNILWVDGHASSMDALAAWGLEKGQNANSFYYFARRKNPSSL